MTDSQPDSQLFVPCKAVMRGTECLTPAELDVARLHAQGLTTREVAARRGRSINTVRFQMMTKVYKKLNINNRWEFFAWATAHNLGTLARPKRKKERKNASS